MKKRLQAIPFHELKKELLSKPGVKKAYDALEAEYQIASQMMDARIKKKMSQAELAIRAGTGQAVISRLEGMNAKPSLTLLRRIANALEIRFHISI